MRTIELGDTGERVSQLALGAMLMGTSTDEPTAFRMLDHYLAAGGSFVDTADCYAWWVARGSAGGESEELLGRWLRARGARDRVFLATKGSALIRDLDEAWADRSVVPRYVGASAGVLRRSIDDSLRRLGVDHVDLYYVHVDDRTTPLEETLSTLASFVSSGKARYIGYSNVRTWRFERIRQLCAANGWPAPVALQQQHSYLRRRAGLSHASIVDDEQMDYLRANREVSLVAYSPMLKGAFDDPRKDGAMWTYVGPDTDARLDVLGKEAASLGVTPGQLVLAWLLHQTDPAMIPLIGPRTFAQYEAAMAALDISLDARHPAAPR